MSYVIVQQKKVQTGKVKKDEKQATLILKTLSLQIVMLLLDPYDLSAQHFSFALSKNKL